MYVLGVNYGQNYNKSEYLQDFRKPDIIYDDFLNSLNRYGVQKEICLILKRNLRSLQNLGSTYKHYGIDIDGF